MTDGTLSKIQFAGVMGVDRAQPTRWVKLGMPQREDGKIPAVEGAQWVRQHVRDYKVRGTVGAGQLRTAEVARWQRSLATAHFLDCEYAARYIAAALAELLPPDQIRDVVSKVLGQLRRDAADSLDQEVRPPSGCSSWLEDPRFQGDQPIEFGWGELLSVEPERIDA